MDVIDVDLFSSDLRWGLLAPAATGVCLHCGRASALHAGSCWSDRFGRFGDGVLAR